MMTHSDSSLLSESYEMVISGRTETRRFIIRTADPDTARRNFPVPGEDFRVLSLTPVLVRENLLTVHELAQALSRHCSEPPQWRTLLDWARAGLIPHQRIGRKFLRFVESDVLAAMKKHARAARRMDDTGDASRS